ncbi:MAG: phospholipase D-like domain-containing protein [Lentisphaerota bacterium]
MKNKYFVSYIDMQLIVEPDDGIEPILSLIASTKKKLDIKQFKFTEPSLIMATINAMQRGVHVRVMLNPTLSTGERDNDESFKQLDAAGVAVRWTNPAFQVTHEKSLVSDGAQALISSFNFAPKYFEKTRDYGILTSIPSLVNEISACFESDWERKPFSPNPEIPLVWSIGDARQRLSDFISSAEETLEVQHIKYVEGILLERIVEAQHRGVHVLVLTGGLHGIPIRDVPETCASLRILHRAGVKVHAQKHPALHAKLMIADGKRALLGSTNLHRHAFELRRELSVIVDDEFIISRLRAVFAADWAGSKHFHAPNPFDATADNPEAFGL